MKLNKEYWIDQLGEGWTSKLKDTLKDPYMEKLMNFLSTEYAMNTVYPKRENLFKAFKDCPWDKLKVVIVCKEPYSDGNANGLALGNNFSSTFLSSQLLELFDIVEKEYYDGLCLEWDFTLENWANQGILMLNTALSVRENRPGSHSKPWKKFILATINAINEYQPGTVFILWDRHSKVLLPYVKDKHHVLFYKGTNEVLKNTNQILYTKHEETLFW